MNQVDTQKHHTVRFCEVKAKQIIICYLSVILFACASNKINSIYMSTDKAPKNCKFVGMIHGGHLADSDNSSRVPKNISELHITQAKGLGANYIEMNSSMDGGKAYSCPAAERSKMNGYR